MATGKVNKRTVDALVKGPAVAFLWDDELRGFGAKITPAGARSYVYQYRMGGREASTQRYSIGAHGSPWTPTTAREEAERLAVLVARGVDPAATNAKRRREAVDLAFKPYSERFLASIDGEGWARLVERTLRLYAAPVLARKALPTITRADVSVVLDRIPRDQQANRRNVFAVLRRLFRWAVARGDLDRSPLEGVETPPAVQARDRVLSDDELRRVWITAGTVHRVFGDVVRMLTATGQRREEVTGLDWTELDRAAALWSLPGARSKNKEGHRVPLNALAVGVLDGVARGTKWPRSGPVFTTSTGGRYTAHSRGKGHLDAALAKDDGGPLPAWRLHDLRRTLATGLQRLGVRFEVTEAVLNHVGGARAGVAGVYQRHGWGDEKRAALDAWGQHVAGLLDPIENNVIPLAARRA
jgi:integrase